MLRTLGMVPCRSFIATVKLGRIEIKVSREKAAKSRTVERVDSR